VPERLATIQIDSGSEMRGGQRQALFLSRGLAALGHRVLVVTPVGTPLASAVGREERLELVELPMRGELSLRAAGSLAEIMRGAHFDLIHTHTPHAISLAHLSRRLGRRPPLVAHRRVAFPLKRNPLARWKRRWPDHWIAVAGSVRDQLEIDGVVRSRISVVTSCLDPERRQPGRPRDEMRADLGLAPDTIAVGTVGHLAAHKGHRVLLDALGRIASTSRQWILFLVGDGELRSALLSQARGLGLEQQVRFLGWREDVPDLLGALDLFVFPSISGEGSPAALKEALVMGLPILASDLAAHKEVGLEPDDLFACGQAADLAPKLAGMIDDPDRARRRGAASVQLTGRFTTEAMVEQTLSVYERLLSNRQVIPTGTRRGMS
jgi:glycosyltransferase involved in cell wall biosynthesis